MRKSIIAFVVLAFSATNSMAQAPEAFNYSGIARNNGSQIANTPIGLELSILKGSATGISVYKETQSSITDTAGYFSVSIGRGLSVDTFSKIDWASNSYFLNVRIDTSGGNNFTDIGTVQLLSVPYALYAKKSGGNLTPCNQIYLAIDSLTKSTDTTLKVSNLILSIRSFGNGKVILDNPLTSSVNSGFVFSIVGGQLVLDYPLNIDTEQLTSFDASILPNNTIQLNSVEILKTISGIVYTNRFRIINP